MSNRVDLRRIARQGRTIIAHPAAHHAFLCFTQLSARSLAFCGRLCGLTTGKGFGYSPASWLREICGVVRICHFYAATRC